MVKLLGNVAYEISVKWDGANWTDETARCKSFLIERGYDDQLTAVRAGTCFLTMADIDGRFNPANSGSALQPYITYPLREVRVRVTYNATTHDLFTGYTRRHEADPGYDAREARIDCVDAFILLDAVRPTTATGSTTGGAIDAMLDEAGFGGATDLDTGDTITFTTDGSKTILGYVEDLLTAERGFFFVAADGTAVYLDRYAANRSPYTSSQGTIASTMRAIAPAVDLDQIFNRATVTASGGTAQTHSADSDALPSGMYRDLPAIATDYLATDAQALSLAKFLVLRNKNPIPPVRFLDINNGQATAFEQLLTRELGDRVTVTESLGGTSGDFHIRRIVHDVDWSRGVHRGSWSLVERSDDQPFLIGISEIGSTDYITY